MTRVAQRRVAARRAPAVRLRRRAVPVARRPVARRPRRRAWIVLLLAAAAIAVWLWPRSEEEPPPPPEPEQVEAPAPAPHPKRVLVKKIAKPAPHASLVDEARLRAALQERAPDLRACGVPAGAPPQVPARLRVAADGKMRTVELTSPVPVPAALASCLRERILAWKFDDLRLQSEVAVLVTFALR
jgi:hypothetical protein